MDPLLPRPAPPVGRGRGALVERLRWYGGRRVAAVGLSLVVAAGVGWWALHPSALPVETRIPVAQRGTAPARSSTTVLPTGVANSQLYVDVAGAVQQPGVYRLDRGARVIDAVRAAGGASADAVLDAVNLAMSLSDGERVYVPRHGDTVVDAATDPTPQVVHVNSATADQLDTLPGVGPATAAAIIAYRTTHGPFATVDALAAVKGIGSAKLDAIRQLIDL